jgi:uncharacterized protein YukE
MTPEHRNILLACIASYGDSLTRIDAEKDQMKAIAAKVTAELNIPASHFTKLATASHKDQVTQAHDDVQAQADLFAVVHEQADLFAVVHEQVSPSVTAMHSLLDEHGATLRIESQEVA